jgi:hypothetical protein
MKMLDQLHRKLRPGDYVLVNDPPFIKPLPAEVVRCFAYNGLCVKFADGRQRYFSSREGFDDILSAARKVGDSYMPL